jgi:hypothetical protein
LLVIAPKINIIQMQGIAGQSIKDNPVGLVLFLQLAQLRGLRRNHDRVYFARMDSDALTII